MNFIFDLDYTLVKRDTDILLPNREEVLRESEKEGKVYIATNQSPPTWNAIYTKRKQKKLANRYYTMGDMISRLESVMRQLPITACYAAMIVGDQHEADEFRRSLRFPDSVIDLTHANIIMSYRIDWRKPHPEMLRYILKYNGIEKKECLFVGDGERDEQAAKNAGIFFQYANEFFV